MPKYQKYNNMSKGRINTLALNRIMNCENKLSIKVRKHREIKLKGKYFFLPDVFVYIMS
jgi:hypothetical protein